MQSKKFLNLNIIKKDYQEVLKCLRATFNKQVTGFSVYRMIDEDEELSDDEFEVTKVGEGEDCKEDKVKLPYDHSINRGFGCTVFGKEGVMRHHKIKLEWDLAKARYSLVDKNTDIESSPDTLNDMFCNMISTRKYKNFDKSKGKGMVDVLREVIIRYDANNVVDVPISELKTLMKIK